LGSKGKAGGRDADPSVLGQWEKPTAQEAEKTLSAVMAARRIAALMRACCCALARMRDPSMLRALPA
jgi:hypothetical protein